MKKINIYLIAALPVTLEALKKQLSSLSTIKITGKSNDLHSPTIFSIKPQPDIIVIDDTCSAREKFIDFINTALRDNYGIKVIIYTNSNDVLYLKSLINRGIKGIISKRTESTSLLLAINIVKRGGVYFESDIVFSIFKNNLFTKFREKDEYDHLSKREETILELKLYGLKNKDISMRLGISIKTVESYVERIKEKLRLESIKELIPLSN